VATAAAKTHRRSKLHEEHEEHVNHERWLITYADMITLLMVLFIVLYSISQVDLAKFEKLRAGMGNPAGSAGKAVLEGGTGPLEGGSAPSVVSVATSNTGGGPQPLASAAREIAAALKQVGLGQSVTLRVESRGLVVSIAADHVLFDAGQAGLRPVGLRILDGLAPTLAGLPNPIRVEGHTDNVPIAGRYPSNWELSSARASSVLRALIDGHGFDPSRFTVAGYADRRPVRPNTTAAGRAANRRVEIVVEATTIAGGA
jgi:chemotaxis protein MotB